MIKTIVVHIRTGLHTVRCDRSTKWGNLFIIGRDGSREDVIRKHRRWIVNQPELMEALDELQGEILGCWCHPLPCHCDTLAELADKKILTSQPKI